MLTAILPLFFLFDLTLSAATFRAAAVKVDITPATTQWLMGYAPRQSNGVHDRIYHRIVAMDDGHVFFLLVSSDLCLFSPSVYDDAVAQLHRELGIEPQNVWWSVTHSHATPEVGPPGIYGALLHGRINTNGTATMLPKSRARLLTAQKKPKQCWNLPVLQLAQGCRWRTSTGAPGMKTVRCLSA